jgi:hypothetical protein
MGDRIFPRLARELAERAQDAEEGPEGAQENGDGYATGVAAPIKRVYAPPGRDGIVLYAGDLEVQTGTGSHPVPGQFELRLFPESWFGVHFKGSFRDLGPISSSPGGRSVTLPAGLNQLGTAIRARSRSPCPAGR